MNTGDILTIIGLIISVLLAAGTAFGGAYAIIYKHTSDSKRHPDANKVVYKDFCEKAQDCLEGAISNVASNLNNLQEGMDKRFDKLEEMIKNLQD